MRVFAALLALAALASCGNEKSGSGTSADAGGDAGASTGGSGGSEAGTGGNAGERGATSGGAGGSVEASNTSGGGDPEPCARPPNVGDTCTAGASCLYGDDCGTTTYACVSGEWAVADATGCGAGAVACADEPEGNDACDNLGEVCDPDDDCLEVLECDAYYWRAFAVCTSVACEDAQPIVFGEPCDLPPGQYCDGAPPCEYTYHCVQGAWTPASSGLPDGCD